MKKKRVTSAMLREILEPSPLTLQAAHLVMPLLRREKITYQHLWDMLDGLWALRRALRPDSKAELADSRESRARKKTTAENLDARFDDRSSVLDYFDAARAVKSVHSLRRKRKRGKRVLLPEFRKLMAKETVGGTKNDLDAVRGDR
jgi:hypothetical protein